MSYIAFLDSYFWYLVLLEGCSKEKHKFQGVASPPGGIFENGLLSNSDTGFRIYVKNLLDWYQGHLLRSFLRRAVARQS